jgi:hypothetical protein
MNINKYLIAAMLGVGLVGTASAQNTGTHSFNNQGKSQVSEEGTLSAADFQTKQMIAVLGLNGDQVIKIHDINVSHAQEIERARIECADDIAGFNEYVDRVASAREQALSNVLSQEQFNAYCEKSNGTWLGMDKYKFRTDDLSVKGNKEDKIKAKGKGGKVSSSSAEAVSSLKARKNTRSRQPDDNGQNTKFPGTNNSNENTFSYGQTLEPSPNSDDFLDVDVSVRANEARKKELDAEQAYQRSLRATDPSAKANEDEEIKLKDGKNKVKSNGHEIKVKNDDLKIKIKESSN